MLRMASELSVFQKIKSNNRFVKSTFHISTGPIKVLRVRVDQTTGNP